MIRVVYCHDNNSLLDKEALQLFLKDYDCVQLETWNEELFNERKKSFAVKSHFAARMNPFCGVFIDDTAKKGFYSEAQQCVLDDIKNYLSELIDRETERRYEQGSMP